MQIDSVEFFDALAEAMNARPERFASLGDADMVAALVMRSDDADWAVRLVFEGLRCEGVAAVDEADARAADFRLVGTRDAWQAMFDDVLANGRAVGRQTINSLTLLGTIRLTGDDPMGLDKFSRFNQTLQEFLDGAAHCAATAG